MIILVVDDCRFARRSLIQILTRLGHTCLEAADSAGALEQLEQAGPVAAATIDWNMPGMNGRDLIVALRKDPRYADLRLIMVSSEADRAHVVDALQVGADEYIMKPFTPEVVEEKLQLLTFLGS